MSKLIIPPVNAQTPASRTEHDKSRGRRAGDSNHKENDMFSVKQKREIAENEKTLIEEDVDCCEVWPNME